MCTQRPRWYAPSEVVLTELRNVLSAMSGALGRRVSAVGCRASGLWRTGGREYAGTVHNHKTIAFPHIDGLAWLLNTHSDSGVSTGVTEAPVSHARNQRVRQAPTTASDRQSVPCHVVTL